jgi:FKBP-type peptidyl-prolyl cis-trans isomerase (trigger factor)
MKHEVTREKDGTIKFTITIPWSTAEKAREKVLDQMSKEVTLPGFRKGAAPKNLAMAKLSKEKVNEETLKSIIPDSYIEAVKKEKILPIVNPRIHVEAFEEGTDVVFSAETTEEPKVTLSEYKDAVKKITAKSKIALPGKEETKPNMNEVIEAVLKSSDITVSHILVEQEVNRLLAQHLDELKTLGLTLEQYLASRGKTAEQLREEYDKKALDDIKLEFTLRKIADKEKITIEQKDIDEALATIKDPEQKKSLLSNPYFLTSILRQQKTLDFLSKI